MAKKISYIILHVNEQTLLMVPTHVLRKFYLLLRYGQFAFGAFASEMKKFPGKTSENPGRSHLLDLAYSTFNAENDFASGRAPLSTTVIFSRIFS